MKQITLEYHGHHIVLTRLGKRWQRKRGWEAEITSPNGRTHLHYAPSCRRARAFALAWARGPRRI